ncbi:outer membrane beta-barrel protein [Pedobacter sp. MC2016-05]|uniref:outer membrane beta-barrel protein n=1 Tax=Pedobacter sp. MC2016-05 TaxID=2994474 RepID=UPI0022483557|nr:outer membrane beta-barrel protein [Pedobacter sp. MC2016-05]MCX2477021.1 outer membrane beta-barrel protein [Pedobacter sp. MC2016-05]
MNLRYSILVLMAFLLASYAASAQKGSNLLQISGSVAIPTGELSKVADVGYGGAIKGLYGVGQQAQQITLEAGYNRFSVKNLPSSVKANYSTIPLYLGYRANLGNIIIEGQSGLAFNHIEGSGPSGTVGSNQTAFGWALSAGYIFRAVELDVRYQNSESGSDTQVIRFVAVRLAYNFSL